MLYSNLINLKINFILWLEEKNITQKMKNYIIDLVREYHQYHKV